MKYVLKTASPTKPRYDLERDLNSQQRAVVTAPPGRILVLAGAGTGKTRTLTYRVAHLVAGGCRPERILLCTFTNRAAREMIARVEDLVAMDMRQSEAGTFHHVGNRIVRRYAERVGLRPDFNILDPEDSRTVIGQVVSELGVGQLTAKMFPQPKVLHGLLGLSAGTRQPLQKVVADRASRFLEQLPTIEEVARKYAERKRMMNLCDFDDLLVHWHHLLTDPEHAEAAGELQAQYQHVLVDEYQDINAQQGSLCDLMAVGSGSLTCVGDDAQSIYSFRGADFAQIHEFPRRHTEAQVLELTINYRSTPEILSLANRTIAHNRAQHQKTLRSVKQAGMIPAVIPLRDTLQQAELVAQRVLELHHEQTLPLRKMAVLYRNHAHSLELQVELTRRGIPYVVRSGTRFFEQAHIKDVVSYLRARENPRDALAWVRLLRLWPGIGAQTAEALALKLAAPEGAPRPRDLFFAEAETGRGRAKKALGRLGELWRILESADVASPADAITAVVKSHYGEYAERSFSNAAARTEDLEHLATFASRYPSAQEFLSELALVQGISAETVMPADRPEDMLVLSTIHQAKGLEWPVCFVLWLADGRFPSAQALRTPAELEEERRLFYVATTRAADELYLLYPTIEQGRDGPSTILRPSRFLIELDRNPVVFDRWSIEEQAADDGG